MNKVPAPERADQTARRRLRQAHHPRGNVSVARERVYRVLVYIDACIRRYGGGRQRRAGTNVAVRLYETLYNVLCLPNVLSWADVEYSH